MTDYVREKILRLLREGDYTVDMEQWDEIVEAVEFNEARTDKDIQLWIDAVMSPLTQA